MKKLFMILSALCQIVIFDVSQAAVPIISNISVGGGDIVDGAQVNITGSGFGTHNMDIQWLGGADGLIETAPLGKTPANTDGWLFNQGAGCNTTAANSQAHSGEQSLYCNLNSTNAFNGAIRYGHPQAIGPGKDIFVSWWVRRVHSGDGQWKMFRINHQNDIQDDSPQAVMFNWDNSKQFFVRIDFGNKDSSSWSPPYPSADDRWYRMDFNIHLSSVGKTDGSYTISLHDPNGGTVIKSKIVDGAMSYLNSSPFYQWFLWQNYIGNGVKSQEMWLDDLYVQVGTQARIEIGDKPVWKDCVFREIQYPEQWGNSNVAIRLNQGSFQSSETAYIFVVDANGNASSGYPITIGGQAEKAVPAPNPPSDVY